MEYMFAQQQQLSGRRQRTDCCAILHPIKSEKSKLFGRRAKAGGSQSL
jgi:hypothetical protein